MLPIKSRDLNASAVFWTCSIQGEKQHILPELDCYLLKFLIYFEFY